MRSFISSLASLLALAIAARAIRPSILVPLYEWPGTTCWPDVLAAGAKYPSQPFTLIINPNSGPGADAKDASFQCLAKLRKTIPKATIIGYVRTGYGKRSTSDVTNDIASYSTFTNSTGGLDGIFFDEASNLSKDVALYQQYAALARSTAKSGKGYVSPSVYAELADGDAKVMLNPGTTTIASYYPFSDAILTYEVSINAFKSVPAATASKPRAKQAFMAYDQQAGASLSTTLNKLFAAKVPSIYLTSLSLDPNPYATRSSLFPSFVAGVVARSS